MVDPLPDWCQPTRRPGRFHGQVQGLDTLLDSADIDVLAGQLDTEDRDPFDRLLADHRPWLRMLPW